MCVPDVCVCVHVRVAQTSCLRMSTRPQLCVLTRVHGYVCGRVSTPEGGLEEEAQASVCVRV